MNDEARIEAELVPAVRWIHCPSVGILLDAIIWAVNHNRRFTAEPRDDYGFSFSFVVVDGKDADLAENEILGGGA